MVEGAIKRHIGRLGVRPDGRQREFERKNPVDAIWLATRDSVVFTWRILSYLGEMIAGRQSAKELGGPIKIAEISGQAAQLGWATLIHFMAILSLNLGLINLFPIPVLDGGHLAMYGVEAVRGRPLSLKIQELSFRVGFVLVMCLIVFATWNDVANHLFRSN